MEILWAGDPARQPSLEITRLGSDRLNLYLPLPGGSLSPSFDHRAAGAEMLYCGLPLANHARGCLTWGNFPLEVIAGFRADQRTRQGGPFVIDWRRLSGLKDRTAAFLVLLFLASGASERALAAHQGDQQQGMPGRPILIPPASSRAMTGSAGGKVRPFFEKNAPVAVAPTSAGSRTGRGG